VADGVVFLTSCRCADRECPALARGHGLQAAWPHELRKAVWSGATKRVFDFSALFIDLSSWPGPAKPLESALGPLGAGRQAGERGQGLKLQHAARRLGGCR